MKVRKLLGQSGQTSVEYILMIVVVIFVSTSVFKKIEEYVVSNPDSFINGYLNAYRQGFGGGNGGFTGAYKYFTVRR